MHTVVSTSIATEVVSPRERAIKPNPVWLIIVIVILIFCIRQVLEENGNTVGTAPVIHKLRENP